MTNIRRAHSDNTLLTFYKIFKIIVKKIFLERKLSKKQSPMDEKMLLVFIGCLYRLFTSYFLYFESTESWHILKCLYTSMLDWYSFGLWNNSQMKYFLIWRKFCFNWLDYSIHGCHLMMCAKRFMKNVIVTNSQRNASVFCGSQKCFCKTICLTWHIGSFNSFQKFKANI